MNHFYKSLCVSILFWSSACSLISDGTHAVNHGLTGDVAAPNEVVADALNVGESKELDVVLELKLSKSVIISGKLESEGAFSFMGGEFPGTGGTCSGPLATVLSTCSLRLHFAPLAAGTHTNKLVLKIHRSSNRSKDSAEAPIEIALKGAATYPQPYNLNTGLVARYRFEEQLTESLVDSSPSGKATASLIGAAESVSKGRVDTSLLLLPHAKILAPDTRELNGSSTPERTVTFWFSAAASPAPHPAVLYSEGNADYGLNAYLENGTLYAGTWNKDVPELASGVFVNLGAISPDKWYHLTLRLNDQFTGFLNGLGVASNTSTNGAALAKRSPIHIGSAGEHSRFEKREFKSCASGCDSYYHGSLDEIRIYNRALAEHEIRHLAHLEFDPSLCTPNPAPGTTFVSVMDPRFGAVGDGVADDTAALKRALSFAKNNHIDRLNFEGKTFLISSVSVPVGLTLSGQCATIKMKSFQNGFNRMLAVPGSYAWSSDENSPTVRIQDFIFDGNSAQQDHSLDLEHQGAIFVSGDKAKQGYVVAEIVDNYFHHLAGDAIYVFYNSTVTAKRNEVRTTKRCSIGTGGTQMNLIIDDMISRAGGGHFDVEPNSDAYRNIHVVMRYSEFDRADMGLASTNSSITVEHSRFTRKLWILAVPSSTVSLTDSEVFQGMEDGYSMVRAPGKETRFTRTRFIAKIPNRDPASGVAYFSPLHIGWRDWPHQKVVVDSCTFEVDGTPLAHDVVRAVYLEAGNTTSDTEVLIVNSFISKEFDTGVELRFGGVVKILNSKIAAAETGLKLRYRDTPDYPGFFYDVEVNQTQISSRVPITPSLAYTIPENTLRIIP